MSLRGETELGDEIFVESDLGVVLDQLRPGLAAADLNRFEVDDEVGEVVGDPVEHDHAQHFVDAPFGFEHTHDDAPDRAGNDDDDQNQSDVHFRNGFEYAVRVITALAENTGEAGGKPDLTSRGKVCTFGDQTAGNTQSDQETDRCVGGKVTEVAP